MSAIPTDHDPLKTGSIHTWSTLSTPVESRQGNDLVDEDAPSFRISTWLFNRKTCDLPNESNIATRRSVYDDPDLAQFYTPKSDYENIHRFDPKARWTYKEERVLLLLVLPFDHSLELTPSSFGRALYVRSTGKLWHGLPSASRPSTLIEGT